MTRIKNNSGRTQSLAGVGTWDVDGSIDVYDHDLADRILMNPYFVEDEEQPEDVDPLAPEESAPFVMPVRGQEEEGPAPEAPAFSMPVRGEVTETETETVAETTPTEGTSEPAARRRA